MNNNHDPYLEAMHKRGCDPADGWILYVPMSHAGRALPAWAKPHPLVKEGCAITLRGEMPTAAPRAPSH